MRYIERHKHSDKLRSRQTPFTIKIDFDNNRHFNDEMITKLHLKDVHYLTVTILLRKKQYQQFKRGSKGDPPKQSKQ